MIALRALTKRYGDTTAVDGLTLDVAAGRVTGFLGPNGSGKSTTMRMVVGLDRPDSGAALVDGLTYGELRHPLRRVGALLEATAPQPACAARAQLLAVARDNGIPADRVEEVLATVELSDVAGKSAGQFSLGMRRRLGVARALLGDPEILLLDEPFSGLDPDGVRWMRRLMRSLAAEGRTVFVSGRQLSELQPVADQLVVIGRGKLLADTPTARFLAEHAAACVLVRLPVAKDRWELGSWLRDEGATVREHDEDALLVQGVPVEAVGEMAYGLGARLYGLAEQPVPLEQAYLDLTASAAP
jgi:ABC-2 type transport system ATP-binding protein